MSEGTIFCVVNVIAANFELVGRNTKDVFDFALVTKNLVLLLNYLKLFYSKLGSFKENAIWAK